jgi:hypothetical protein
VGGRSACATIVTSQPEERLEELVLIFSNGQWEDPLSPVELPAGSFPYRVVTSNIACKGWTGTIALGDDGAPGGLSLRGTAGQAPQPGEGYVSIHNTDIDIQIIEWVGAYCAKACLKGGKFMEPIFLS